MRLNLALERGGGDTNRESVVEEGLESAETFETLAAEDGVDRSCPLRMRNQDDDDHLPVASNK